MLRSLANSIVVTGTMSEWHLQNLKTWPFAFFNGVEECELAYFVPTSEDMKAGNTRPSVTYTLKMDPTADHSQMQKRVDAVVNSVKTLLWQDMDVVILDEKTNKPVLEIHGKSGQQPTGESV